MFAFVACLFLNCCAPIPREPLPDQYGQGYFGVRMVPEVDGSVKVYEVMPNSAALRAGLKEGDILMKLDDIQIDGDESLRELIVSLRPGSQVELSIKREDKPMKINLRVMGKLPARQ